MLIHKYTCLYTHASRANKESGAFRDCAHYLDVQFRLLREDYVRPLRDGLHQYKQRRDTGQAIGRLDDVR